MLVDYLEESSEELQSLYNRLHKLDKQYRTFFDRNIREEMARVKKSIRKKRFEINEELYCRLQELEFLRRYFPEFFSVLLEYEYVGHSIKVKLWLLDFKKKDAETCKKKLKELKNQRRELRKAREFLRKWVGKIDAKSLVATWPLLKSHVQKTMDKDEALEAVKKAAKELRKKGWLILLNEPYVVDILQRFLTKLHKASGQEQKLKRKVDTAKGQGSVAEYDSLREYKKIQRRRKRWERFCRHLLFCNTVLLEKLKTGKISLKEKELDSKAKLLAQSVNPRKVGEKIWMQEMKKKLSS